MENFRNTGSSINYCQTTIWMPREIKPALKAMLMSKGLTMSQFFNAAALALVTKDIKLKRTSYNNSFRVNSLAATVGDATEFFKNLGVVLTDRQGNVLNKTTIEQLLNEGDAYNVEDEEDEAKDEAPSETAE